MNISKNTILVWAVIILMALNVVLLVFMWSKQNKQRPPVGGTPADFLVKELSLDSAQQNTLRSLARQHHSQAEQIRVQIKEARHNFFRLLNEPNVNDSIKKAAADSVANNLEQLDILTFDHFKQVRALCTAEQQKKFDEIIEDVLRMIANPQGRPQRNGGLRPPPGDHLPPPEQ